MPSKNAAVATHNNHIVPIPIAEVRGILGNILNMQSWRDIYTPLAIMEVTATKQDILRGHSKQECNYKLVISYDKHDENSSVLNYKLTDERGVNKLKCQEKLEELIEAVNRLALNAAKTKTIQPTPVTHGAARFADDAELRTKGYIVTDPPANRLLLAPWKDGEFLVVPEQFTNMHGMICGPTGAGKSSGFFIPNLVYRTGTSAIVTEATVGDEMPDLYQKTAGWRQFKGSKIYFFNPDYAKGTRINPLDKMKIVSQDEFAQAADELANLVIANTTPPGTVRADPIWDKSEKHLLWIMIMHVASSANPAEANFGTIREIVRQNDKQIKKILKTSNSEIAREEFDSFIAHSSENFRHGVFAGLLQKLNPWLSSIIQTMTSATDLDFRELEKENFTFYLSVPSRKHYVKPIAALIFNFIFDMTLKPHFKYPPALFLDEFTNFGAIPGIDKALSIIRKSNIPVMLGYQTHTQLVTTYTQDMANEITSQLATRVFFRPRKARDAQDLSDALDDTTIVEKRTDDRGNTMVRELGRPLMSVRDIFNLPADEVIVMTESTNPIKTKRFDYNNCPAPLGYDLPDLPEHKLVKVERLSEAAVGMEEKKAKRTAEKDEDFENVKVQVEEVIAAAQETHRLTPVEDIAKPVTQVLEEKKEEPAPEPKKKKKRRIPDADDDWKIPSG